MSHQQTPARRSFSHQEVACNGRSPKDIIGGMGCDISQDSAGSDQRVINFIPFQGFRKASKSASVNSVREENRPAVYLSPSSNTATNNFPNFQTNEKIITLANEMLQIRIRIPLYLEDSFRDSAWKVADGMVASFVTCPIADTIVSHVVVQPVIKIKDLEEFNNMMDKRYAGGWSERTTGTTYSGLFPNIVDLDNFINEAGNTPTALRPTGSYTFLTENLNEVISGKSNDVPAAPPSSDPAPDVPLSSGPDSPTLVNMKMEKHLSTPAASPDAFVVYQQSGVVAGSSSADSIGQSSGSPTSVTHPAAAPPLEVPVQPSNVPREEPEAPKANPGVSTRSRIIRKAPRSRGRATRSSGNSRTQPSLPHGLTPHDPNLGSQMIIVGGCTPDEAPRQVRRSVRNQRKPTEGRWSKAR